MDLKDIERFKREVAFKLTDQELKTLDDIAKMVKDYDFDTVCEKLDLAEYIS